MTEAVGFILAQRAVAIPAFGWRLSVYAAPSQSLRRQL
jgi:hypothetical protein